MGSEWCLSKDSVQSLEGRRKTLPMLLKEQNRSALKEEQRLKLCFCFPPSLHPSHTHKHYFVTTATTSLFIWPWAERKEIQSFSRPPLIFGASFQSFHGSLFEYHLWNGNLSVKHETEGEERGGFGWGKGGRPPFNY